VREKKKERSMVLYEEEVENNNPRNARCFIRAKKGEKKKKMIGKLRCKGEKEKEFETTNIPLFSRPTSSQID